MPFFLTTANFTPVRGDTSEEGVSASSTFLDTSRGGVAIYGLSLHFLNKKCDKNDITSWLGMPHTHTHPSGLIRNFQQKQDFQKKKTGTFEKFARNFAVPRVSRLSQKKGRPFFRNKPAFLEVPLLHHPSRRIHLGHFAFFSYDREAYLEKCLCVVNIF